MMNFDVLTIFPDFFSSFKGTSIIKNAIKSGLICIETHNIRDYTKDKHKMTDDLPFGGGSGMVMKAEPIIKCIKDVSKNKMNALKILLSPKGKTLNQDIAYELTNKSNIMLVCPRYEGPDERIMKYIDMELSIGDFIISGGEPAALVVIDSISRLIPGVLGNKNSLNEESFRDNLLEYPQYTRPEVFEVDGEKLSAPKVLLSGNHANIKKWQRMQSLIQTFHKRPKLLDTANITNEEKDFLMRYISENLTHEEKDFLKGK